MFRHFLFIFITLSIFSTSSEAVIVSRRQFLVTCGVLAGGLNHPDYHTFGVDSFGRTVKDILNETRFGLTPVVSERLRRHLQNKIWEAIDPTTLQKPERVSLTFAVWIEKDQYLYLTPTFEAVPFGPGESTEPNRTLRRIEYFEKADSKPSLLKSIPYYVAGKPSETSVIILGPEHRNTDAQDLTLR